MQTLEGSVGFSEVQALFRQHQVSHALDQPPKLLKLSIFALNPQPSTLNSQASTRNPQAPKPCIQSEWRFWQALFEDAWRKRNFEVEDEVVVSVEDRELSATVLKVHDQYNIDVELRVCSQARNLAVVAFVGDTLRLCRVFESFNTGPLF